MTTNTPSLEQLALARMAHDAARLIRQQGVLGRGGQLAHCAVGVLWHEAGGPGGINWSPLYRAYRKRYKITVPDDNDRFKGTQAARAEFMAKRFEALAEGRGV